MTDPHREPTHDETADGSVTVISARLSELNAEQLGQLLRQVGRQRDQAVAQSQAKGEQIDALRAQRAELADAIRKAGADEQYLLALIKAAEARAAATAAAPRAAAPGAELVTLTAADVARVDAVAPGVVLQASAKVDVAGKSNNG